jgi:hypothetical protein
VVAAGAQGLMIYEFIQTPFAQKLRRDELAHSTTLPRYPAPAAARQRHDREQHAGRRHYLAIFRLISSPVLPLLV